MREIRIDILNIDDLIDELDNVSELGEEAIIRTANFLVRSVAQRAKGLIRNSSPTGRVYNKNGRLHQASAPGEPPANDTGSLADGITFTLMTKNNMLAVVLAPANYASLLEFGGFNEEGNFVAPRPFMHPAWTEATARAGKVLKKEFESLV